MYTPREYYDIEVPDFSGAIHQVPAANEALEQLEKWLVQWEHAVSRGEGRVKVRNKERMLSFVGCCIAKAIHEIDKALGASSPHETVFGGRVYRAMEKKPWQEF